MDSELIRTPVIYDIPVSFCFLGELNRDVRDRHANVRVNSNITRYGKRVHNKTAEVNTETVCADKEVGKTGRERERIVCPDD